MIEFGLICDIDAPKGLAKVFIPDTKVTTEFIPFLRRFGLGNSESIPMTVNELVLVGKTSSDRWFILGASPNNEDMPYSGASAQKLGVKFTDGCLVEYDIASSKLTIVTGGEVNVTASKITVAAPEILLDGIVTVSGALVASAGLAVTGDVVSGGISLTSHKHSGVTTGGGISGNPIVE